MGEFEDKIDYEIISSEKKHIGRFEIIYDIIERKGERYPYSYIKMKQGVGILAFYNNNVILLKQYRYIWDSWILEIPGGMVDDGEDSMLAAKRELEEETGFVANKIHSLGICYPSVGSTTELQHLFFAECDKKVNQDLDGIEQINVELISIHDFEKMIFKNEFCHGMGLAAWCRYKEGSYEQIGKD